MPKQITYFWRASVVLAIFWATMTMFNAINNLESVAKFPTFLRGPAHLTYFMHPIFEIVIQEGILLLAAWLVVFRRKGWARYLFVVVILSDLFSSILIALFYDGLSAASALRPWFDPTKYVTVAFLGVSLFFVFSEPARRWFATTE
jgi:urea transporter